MNNKRTQLVTLENYKDISKYWGHGRRIYGKAALDLGYKVTDYRTARAVHISNGEEHYFFRGFFTPLNNLASSKIADNKHFTNEILAASNIPVSKCTTIDRKQYEENNWSIVHIPYPLVVKPLKETAGGKDVMTNVRNRKELEQTLDYLLDKYKVVLVEEFHDNLQDYRVLVLDGDVIAVTERKAAHIVGDGKHTIAELIELKNETRGKNINIKLNLIPVDQELVRKIEESGYNLDAVLQTGEYLRLRNVCNTGTGGEVHDATDQICEENKELAKRTAAALGLRLAGMDFLCEDISQPLEAGRGVIIEVNQHPDITLHHYPMKGKAYEPAKDILQSLFQ